MHLHNQLMMKSLSDPQTIDHVVRLQFPDPDALHDAILQLHVAITGNPIGLEVTSRASA